MSTAIGTTIHEFSLPVDRVQELISGDTSFCNITLFQKFVDFFRYIFTGHSLHEDHKSIFNFVNVDDSEILNSLCENENEKEKWHSVLCIARLIDNTQEHFKENYSMKYVETENGGGEVEFMYSNYSIKKLCFSKNEMDVIEKNMFTKNDGKPVVYDSCSSIPLECQLYDALDDYLKRTENNNQVCYRDDKNQEDNKVFDFQSDSVLSGNKNISEVAQEVAFKTSSVEEGANNIVADIDVFIRDKIEGKTLDEIISEARKIGSGAYGTVYKVDDFVVKTPVNKENKKVDFYGYNRSAYPFRTSEYLNKANDDMHFSRGVTVKKGGGDNTSIDILVSRFINGSNVTDEELGEALNKLYARGLDMYDYDVEGNILKTIEGEYYFVDADQIVISLDERKKARRLSQATKDLENMLLDQYKMKAHTEKISGEQDGFYNRELQVLEEMIKAGQSDDPVVLRSNG